MGQTVAVVGGGYGGTLVAHALDAEADVVLIDPRDAFLNVAGSLRALTRPEWAHNVFFPYRSLLERGRVVRDSAASVDAGGVTLAGGGRVDADYIVLATGSAYAYPARPRRADASAEEALGELRETHAGLSSAGRVLIVGAGPVGLELAGEIHEVWPGKHVVVVDAAHELLPGFLPEVRAELHRQLDELGIELRLGTSLTALPPVEDGTAETFTVTTSAGDRITADIWFRCFGVRVNTGYLADGKLVTLTADGMVPVDEHLNAGGHGHVYALGDIAALADAKMATHAQSQAMVVVENLRARLKGTLPEAVYRPAPVRRIFLPLGTRGGVGQLPMPDGTAAQAPLETVIERKGADLFTARFAERFGRG
jgi:NADH dehydrogenase FAD-containing subunit